MVFCTCKNASYACVVTFVDLTDGIKYLGRISRLPHRRIFNQTHCLSLASEITRITGRIRRENSLREYKDHEPHLNASTTQVQLNTNVMSSVHKIGTDLP